MGFLRSKYASWAFVSAVATGAVFQGLYIYLYSKLPIGIVIAAITASVAALSMARIALSFDRVTSNPMLPIFFVIFILIAYCFPIGLIYFGKSIFELYDPILITISYSILCISVLLFIPTFPNALVIATLTCLLIGIGHFVLSDTDAWEALGGSSLRYGYVDRNNFINITGQNLAYFLLAAYIIFRFGKQSSWAIRAMGGIATALLLLPLLATGSRAAYLTVLLVLLTAEINWSGWRSTLSIALIGVVGLGLANWLTGNETILSYAFERLSLLGGEDDLAATGRLENAFAAMDLDLGLFFGVGLTGREFLGVAPDNAVANLLISIGIVGTLLVASLVAISIWTLTNSVDSRLGTACLFLIPLAVRAMAEGTLIQKSALFPAALYTIVITVVGLERRYSQSRGIERDRRLKRLRAESRHKLSPVSSGTLRSESKFVVDRSSRHS